MKNSIKFLAFSLILSICLVSCHEQIKMPHKEMSQMQNSYKHQSYSAYYYQEGQASPVQKSLYREENPQFNVSIEKDGNSTKVTYDFPKPSTSASLANETISEFKFDFNLKGGHPLFDNKIGYVLLAVVLFGALCCAIHMVKICCCAHKKCHKRECVEVLQFQPQQQQQQQPQAPLRIQVPQQQQMIPLQQMSYPQPQPQPQAAQQSFVQLNQNLMPMYKPPVFVAQQPQQKMMPIIVQQPRMPLQQQQQMFMQAPVYYQVPQQYKMMQQQQQPKQQGFASGIPVYDEVNSPAGYNYPSVLEMNKQY